MINYTVYSVDFYNIITLYNLKSINYNYRHEENKQHFFERMTIST